MQRLLGDSVLVPDPDRYQNLNFHGVYGNFRGFHGNFDGFYGNSHGFYGNFHRLHWTHLQKYRTNLTGDWGYCTFQPVKTNELTDSLCLVVLNQSPYENV